MSSSNDTVANPNERVEIISRWRRWVRKSELFWVVAIFVSIVVQAQRSYGMSDSRLVLISE
jgi:hypothetical protein